MIDTMNGCGAPLVLAMQIFEARDRHALLHSFDEFVAHHLDDVTIGGRLLTADACSCIPSKAALPRAFPKRKQRQLDTLD